MSLIALVIFTFTLWAVFSRHFADGIIAKNLLSLAAITAVLTIVDPCNPWPAITAGVLVLVGVSYAYFRPTRRRPLFWDRRRTVRPARG